MANKKSFAFTPVSRENVSIDFSIISSQDRPALRLNNGRGAFFVDWGNTTGGCWKMRYHDDLLLSGQEHGMIGEISFNDRNQVSPFTGTYAGASIRNGIAAVAFSGTVGSYPGANPQPNPLEGLKIEKILWKV